METIIYDQDELAEVLLTEKLGTAIKLCKLLAEKDYAVSLCHSAPEYRHNITWDDEWSICFREPKKVTVEV